MPDKLAIILYSGAFDRIHYALALASAAAAGQCDVSILVTMAAFRAFTPQGRDNLSLSDGVVGTSPTPSTLDDYYHSHGIARFDELAEACVALGVNFMACEMGLRAANLTLQDLEASLQFSVSGLTSLLGTVKGEGKLVFV